MSVIRKLTLSVAGVFVAVLGITVAAPAATALADCTWDTPAPNAAAQAPVD